MDGGLKIGELARRADVTTKAIRFYERKGLLPVAKRAANRYRVYGDDAAEILRFIKQATGLGLRLGEIKDILVIRQGGRPPCAHVHQLLRDKAGVPEHRRARGGGATPAIANRPRTERGGREPWSSWSYTSPE
jgi:DNA-binding transcriptional MerR regulator